jgi:hypothetical protein
MARHFCLGDLLFYRLLSHLSKMSILKINHPIDRPVTHIPKTQLF